MRLLHSPRHCDDVIQLIQYFPPIFWVEDKSTRHPHREYSFEELQSAHCIYEMNY